jgi:hypothetical protein
VEALDAPFDSGGGDDEPTWRVEITFGGHNFKKNSAVTLNQHLSTILGPFRHRQMHVHATATGNQQATSQHQPHSGRTNARAKTLEASHALNNRVVF